MFWFCDFVLFVFIFIYFNIKEISELIVDTVNFENGISGFNILLRILN